MPHANGYQAKVLRVPREERVREEILEMASPDLVGADAGMTGYVTDGADVVGSGGRRDQAPSEEP